MKIGSMISMLYFRA